MKKATFAAGCFWHVEEVFSKTPGVKSTQVGYTGGNLENPTYEQVCTDRTGHAEAIEVEYEPEEISYKELLKVFFENHNPTTPNRQGPDFGIQYRSAIFCHDSEQEELAKEIKEKLNQIFVGNYTFVRSKFYNFCMTSGSFTYFFVSNIRIISSTVTNFC